MRNRKSRALRHPVNLKVQLGLVVPPGLGSRCLANLQGSAALHPALFSDVPKGRGF